MSRLCLVFGHKWEYTKKSPDKELKERGYNINLNRFQKASNLAKTLNIRPDEVKTCSRCGYERDSVEKFIEIYKFL